MLYVCDILIIIKRLGVISMAQTMVNFRMDEELKKNMEKTCENMGMSITTAFRIFAIKVAKERRIPFDIEEEPHPFYSEENMNRLRKAIADADAGRNMTEHELIEVDDDEEDMA